MSRKLTEEECQELSDKIDSEGFDYYFCDYGADQRLEDICENEIDAYENARKALASALIAAGLEINI